MNWWHRWKVRHQHPASLVLHAVGIPLMVVALIVTIVQLLEWRWDLWWRPLALLTISYLLQWCGHLIEGNTMGELIVIYRWLGKPYTAIAPQYQSNADASDDAHITQSG